MIKISQVSDFYDIFKVFLKLEIQEEYEEILEDIKKECEKEGKVIQIVIPRPQKGKHVKGLGKVFIQFETMESSKAARAKLTKKLFDDNIVEANYLNEEWFKNGDFDHVEGP